MKTIVPAKENIAKLWGHPKPKEDVQYRPMKYLLKTQVEDGTLLYNVVTSEMILLDEAETRLFEETRNTDRPVMGSLVSKHFLVTEDFDEYKSVKQLRDILKKLSIHKGIVGYTILPTTCCNAHCYYCFESDFPRQTMSNEIINDVVEYIASHSESQPIRISWFGGEPMVSSDCISKICGGLRQKGINYSSSMVSNAYLFTDELVNAAKELWNMTSVQITIDGTEEVYNATKAYRNVQGSPYQRVLANIEKLLSVGISTNIRLNTMLGNIDNLTELVDELAKRFSGRKGFTMYAHSIFDSVGYNPLNYDIDERIMLADKTANIERKMRDCGVLGAKSKLPYLRLNCCMADTDVARVIYPDGSVGKCENCSQVDAIGNIFEDITDRRGYDKFKETIDFDQCPNCPIYPYCVNLRNCAETNGCFDPEKEWRIERFTEMLVKQYSSSSISLHGETDDNTIEECS